MKKSTIDFETPARLRALISEAILAGNIENTNRNIEYVIQHTLLRLAFRFVSSAHAEFTTSLSMQLLIGELLDQHMKYYSVVNPNKSGSGLERASECLEEAIIADSGNAAAAMCILFMANGRMQTRSARIDFILRIHAAGVCLTELDPFENSFLLADALLRKVRGDIDLRRSSHRELSEQVWSNAKDITDSLLSIRVRNVEWSWAHAERAAWLLAYSVRQYILMENSIGTLAVFATTLSNMIERGE